jgi:pyruvate/2-oxoglutarate dehydrogenase complex dihydrolipoamide acyltransferase (E2) component
MKIEVPLPSLGEDANPEAQVSAWLAAVGDHLNEGDDLIEMVTDKAAFTVPCPRAGVLREWRVAEGDDVTVGDIIAVIEA